MKPSSYIFVALAICCTLCCPASAEPTLIQITDRVPVSIETGCYRQVPDSNQHILILSSRCSFWTLGTGRHVSATVFHFNDPLPSSLRSHLAYRLVTAADSGVWKPVPENGQTAERIFLAQVSLLPGQHCSLQFMEMSAGTLIQQLVVERVRMVPVYKSFRQHAGQLHTEEDALFSKSLQGKAPGSGATGLLPGNMLQLEPGKATDILLENQRFSVDSSLEYSFEPFEKTHVTHWQTTGTVLHLDPLPGARNYVLQVRYKGMATPLVLVVASQPYWYQHIVFKVLLFLLLAALLLLGPWYVYQYRSRREKWLRSRLEGQLQLVHNQLNPHFIFNSLSSITSLIGSGDNDRAIEYLSVFSGMMRHTMAVSDKTVISLADDLDQMEQYLRIEQLRFQFRYEINVSPAMNLNTIELPPQLLQPSLENAVKHGASGLLAGGEVKLRIYAENSDLHIRIVNNSKAGYRRPDNGQGQGLQFTNEQMSYLRQLFREREIRFDLHIADDGAEASFFFENWLNPE